MALYMVLALSSGQVLESFRSYSFYATFVIISFISFFLPIHLDVLIGVFLCIDYLMKKSDECGFSSSVNTVSMDIYINLFGWSGQCALYLQKCLRTDELNWLHW